MLWRRLRNGGVSGLKFRRQHPIGPFVLDFYCEAARLVVEVDGWGHNMSDQPQRDLGRDAWLVEQGLRVLRLPAVDVLKDADDVVRRIALTAGAL